MALNTINTSTIGIKALYINTMYFTEDISMIKTETEDSSFAAPSTRQNSAKGQMSSFLPPCRVCGDKASGFHYGANTCEACKVS